MNQKSADLGGFFEPVRFLHALVVVLSYFTYTSIQEIMEAMRYKLENTMENRGNTSMAFVEKSVIESHNNLNKNEFYSTIPNEKFNYIDSCDPVFLTKTLETSGIVFSSNVVSASEFMDVCSDIGEPYNHADSRSDGITHIHSKNADISQAAAQNLKAMTSGALFPHTDRSGVSRPPRYLAVWMESEAPIGGVSIFVDGNAVLEQLSAYHPHVIEPLSRPKSVVFKSNEGLVESSIFEFSGSVIKIRYRMDNMIYMAPDVTDVMPLLKDAIEKVSFRHRVGAGEGYILDNHRWLHGRTHFCGNRSAYRLLLNPFAKK